MPQGMRSPLYIRDDDYRYSFLFGNFVTLTNLTEDDWDRLSEQRLSPLYVSVHATDQDLRRRILRSRTASDVVEQLKRLGELGIEVHAQIVLLPGLNDDHHLDRTVADLAALYPAVQSIGVVPLGLTRYHTCSLRTYGPDEAGSIVDQIGTWQREYRNRLGLGLVYASDEWYLLAGLEVPPAEQYDGFPQLENGVGLTRLLLDEEFEVSDDESRVGKVALVCGTLIAPLLQDMTANLAARTGLEIEVIPVVNAFFGPTVTVSGLLTGRDVVAALRGRDLGEVVFLPRAMFDASGKLTLDDMSVAQIGERLGTRVEAAGTLGEVVGVLCA
jgi:putative radical SAM enzyme (TIGR03279 family)